MQKSPVQSAAWKIIQMYYVVYCSISSMTRCVDDQLISPGHRKMHSVFIQQFVTCPKRARFLLLPANIYLSIKNGASHVDGTRLRYDVPNVKKGLEWASNRPRLKGLGAISIPQYLMELREWANCEDAYLLFLLYGPYVRDKLEQSMNEITSLYLVQAEYFMIEVHGWQNMYIHYNLFQKEANRAGVELKSLQERFATYGEFFSDSALEV
jgi:hypothetical protein